MVKKKVYPSIIYVWPPPYPSIFQDCKFNQNMVIDLLCSLFIEPSYEMEKGEGLLRLNIKDKIKEVMSSV